MLKSGSRPLLMGHRGVRPRPHVGEAENLPSENTVPAFEYALAHGCDGFEFDVRFTRDQRAVLCHDPRLAGLEIATATYADLSRERADLACLEDIFERFGSSAYLDIELKVGGNEGAIVAALRASTLPRGYVITTFFPHILMRLHEMDSELPLGYICDRPEYVDLWTKLPISAFIPHHRLVSSQLVEDVHSRGLKLLTWTVNRQADLLRLADWGVDGLISDDPALLGRTFL